MSHGRSLFILWSILFLNCAYGVQINSEPLRINLTAYNASALYLSSEAEFTLLNASDNQSFALKANTTCSLTCKDGKISAEFNNKKIISSSLYIQSDNAVLSIGKDINKMKPYRGELKIEIKNNKLIPINVVPLEEYLLSVVPAEMPYKWNVEALKAQAIAARSYAVSRRGKYDSEGFDLTDDIMSQVYMGKSYEKESATTAVKETAGIILMYKDEVADCVYHADCGGQTAASHETGFGKPKPYLTGTTDKNLDGDYCSESPKHSWSITLTSKELEKILEKIGINIGSLTSAEVVKTGASKRVLSVLFKGKKGEAAVYGTTLRRIIGYNRLPSVMFTVSKASNGWKFTGNGYGHGVGLCQWGAKGRADAGQSFDVILQAYYPGTELRYINGALYASAKKNKGLDASKVTPNADQPTYDYKPKAKPSFTSAEPAELSYTKQNEPKPSSNENQKEEAKDKPKDKPKDSGKLPPKEWR